MPFPRLSNLFRRQRKRSPAYTPVPAPPSPRVVSPRKMQRPSTPPIWGSSEEVFTGVRDASWYDDLLEVIIDECAKGAAQRECSSIASEVKGEREVLFDADVWVELARAKEAVRLPPVRRCVASCKVPKGYYGDVDIEELWRLTEAFMGDYYDGECTCLDGGVSGAVCLPGENFPSAGSVSGPWEISAGYVLLAEDQESVISETESIFDHMDEVVQDVLWKDAGVTDVSIVHYVADRSYGMFCDPPTPWSMITDVSECDEDAVVGHISDAEETTFPTLLL